MVSAKTLVTRLLRALPVLFVAVIFLFAVFALTGCAALRPDAYTVALVHQSSPFKGPSPAPFGDNGRSLESNLDGAELGVEWEHGIVFWDASAIYAIGTTNMEGGPWYTQFRLGVRLAP